MAFDAGLCPEEGLDTARYVRDEPGGTLRIEVDGSGRAPTKLDLATHRAALERLWRGDRFAREYARSGRQYRLEYTARPEEMQVRFVPAGNDAPKPQQGA
jgi:hypothetical protein